MKEEQLHKAICNYLQIVYPDVAFTTDLSGLKLPVLLAKKVAKLRSGNGFPDIQIFQSGGKRVVEYMGEDVVVFEFAGLFLEVKKETPYKKNGELKKQRIKSGKGSYDHLQMQDDRHRHLAKQGYLACFVWDFEQAKDLIDDYMKL